MTERRSLSRGGGYHADPDLDGERREERQTRGTLSLILTLRGDRRRASGRDLRARWSVGECYPVAAVCSGEVQTFDYNRNN